MEPKNMKKLKRNLAGSRYQFRGTTFHIPRPELPAAIRESRKLHNRLVDDLVAEAKRQAALLKSAASTASRRKPEADDHNGRRSDDRTSNRQCGETAVEARARDLAAGSIQLRFPGRRAQADGTELDECGAQRGAGRAPAPMPPH